MMNGNENEDVQLEGNQLLSEMIMDNEILEQNLELLYKKIQVGKRITNQIFKKNNEHEVNVAKLRKENMFIKIVKQNLIDENTKSINEYKEDLMKRNETIKKLTTELREMNSNVNELEEEVDFYKQRIYNNKKSNKKSKDKKKMSKNKSRKKKKLENVKKSEVEKIFEDEEESGLKKMVKKFFQKLKNENGPDKGKNV